MTNSFLDSNLSLLSRYDPATAERIKAHAPGGGAEIAQTPSGYPTLKVRVSDRMALLHSGKDPLREAQRWAETVQRPAMYNLMVLGAGLMYHAHQMVLKYHGNLQHLVIVETRMDTLRLAFEHADLSPFLLTKKTFFLAKPTVSELRAFMNRFLTPFTLDGLEIVEHPGSVESMPEEYARIRETVRESLQNGEIMLRTKVQLGGMIQENIVRNVPELLRNPGASALRGLLRDVPAFVVCAGPSLDWNVDQLARVGERGVIVAVDTVYKKLLERGIAPHIVVSTDPTPLNTRHFEGVEELGETLFAFSPSVNYKIPRQLRGTKVSLPLPASKLLGAMKNVLGDQGYMSTGVNVGQTAYNLARFMECAPIALAGLDLSFPAEGGPTHASGTALRRRIKRASTPGKMMVELISDPPEWEEFEPILVPGLRGGNVATNKFWLAYLRSFEEEIKKTGVPVVNCTEGGARIEGAEAMTLSDFIQTHCGREWMPGSTLQMSVGFFFGMNEDEGASVLREAKGILERAVEKAGEGLNQLDAIETLANSATPNRDLIREELGKIGPLHEELVQNHKVYAVLDEAADRVLTPFLRQGNRPQGDEPSPENVRKTLIRYREYFSGMNDLCRRFETVLDETLQSLEPGGWGQFPE